MRRFPIHSALISAFIGALAAIPVLLALLGAPVPAMAAARPQSDGPTKPAHKGSDQSPDQSSNGGFKRGL